VLLTQVKLLVVIDPKLLIFVVAKATSYYELENNAYFRVIFGTDSSA
jgi:hypothetical protein